MKKTKLASRPKGMPALDSEDFTARDFRSALAMKGFDITDELLELHNHCKVNRDDPKFAAIDQKLLESVQKLVIKPQEQKSDSTITIRMDPSLLHFTQPEKIIEGVAVSVPVEGSNA